MRHFIFSDQETATLKTLLTHALKVCETSQNVAALLGFNKLDAEAIETLRDKIRVGEKTEKK